MSKKNTPNVWQLAGMNVIICVINVHMYNITDVLLRIRTEQNIEHFASIYLAQGVDQTSTPYPLDLVGKDRRRLMLLVQQ